MFSIRCTRQPRYNPILAGSISGTPPNDPRESRCCHLRLVLRDSRVEEQFIVEQEKIAKSGDYPDFIKLI